MALRSITPEQLRILVAAAESRLRLDSTTYRYEIEGEDPPDRRERERLQKRGLLSRPGPDNPRILTDKGVEALRDAPVQREAPPTEQLEIA